MVLVDKGGHASSGRHYVSDFKLGPADYAHKPTPPRPARPIWKAAPATEPRAAPAAPARTTVEPAARTPYSRSTVQTKPTQPRSARPTVLYGGTKPPVKMPSSAVLDNAQRETALEGLGVRKHLIREEVMEQVHDIVYGKRVGISFTLTDIESRIFNMLGIPGF